MASSQTLSVIIKGKDNASKQLNAVGKSATSMGKKVTKAGLAIGIMAAAVGVAMGKVIKDWAAAGNEVQKMNLRTGIATESLSEYKHALEISGSSLSDFEKGVKRMQKTIVDAGEGMTTYIRAFDRMGISVDDLIGLAPERQFEIISTAMAGMTDATTKAATAQDIFGRAGANLLPMLSLGAAGINELKQEAHELGIVFDQEAANAAASLTDSFDRLSKSITGLKFAMAEALAPILEPFILWLTRVVQGTAILTDAQLAHNAVMDNQRKLVVEGTKAYQGLANTYLKTLRTQRDLTETYVKLREVSDEQKAIWNESIKVMAATIKEFEAYNSGLDEAADAAARATDAAIANVQAAIQQEQVYLSLTVAANILREAEKAATAATLAGIAAKNAAFAQLARNNLAQGISRQGSLIEQIYRGGGTPSQERLNAFYADMYRLSPNYRNVDPAGLGGGVNITIQGSVVSERDLVNAVRNGLLDTQDSNYSTGIS